MYNPEYPCIAADDDHAWYDEGGDKQHCFGWPFVFVANYCAAFSFVTVVIFPCFNRLLLITECLNKHGLIILINQSV